MIKKTYTHKGTFALESGETLNDIEIAYHISEATINSAKPVIWICHALTANSDAEDWWPGLVGKGKLFDPDKYTLVCANILGSCYGTTGALSVNPATGRPWLNDFPLVTVRDWARAHELLREHLGIDKIYLVAGGSIGGFQSMEWAIMHPERFEHMMLVATSYMQTAWANAINETERMSIEADSTFFNGDPNGGKAGLAAARGLGLLSYRGYEAYNLTQSEKDNEQVENFRASSYQRYQGKKLVDRFNAHCYHSITRSQDTHNVARGRGSFEEAFTKVTAKTLCVGISTDILFPPIEQKRLAEYIPNAIYAEIDSDFGHDGFLIESEQLSEIIREYLL
ncbi:MAG: homoserine O-acetyltransferase [Tenuifilaceae bacterium]|nr:homoserine O-acetyltransferase [Tenuifilaceae bacterium]